MQYINLFTYCFRVDDILYTSLHSTVKPASALCSDLEIMFTASPHVFVPC